MTAADLNRIYTIPDLWRKLGLAGDPPRPGQKVCSPLRPDLNPSFAIFEDGYKARDFSLGISYSAIDFFGAIRGIPNDRQVAEYWEWIRQQGAAPNTAASPNPARRGPVLNDVDKLRPPTDDECRLIAQSRKLDPGAIQLAGQWGTLKVGSVFGFPSWVLTDHARVVAEARRIDGCKFPAQGYLTERKAHTFRYSKKNWPIGLWVPQHIAFPRALMVEGGPDYLAAVQLVAIDTANFGNVIVCTMLGAESLMSETPLRRLAGKTVRILFHEDQTRVGETAAARWVTQLQGAGCQNISAWHLEPGFDDLNDFVAKATNEQKQNLANLLYV